MSSSLKCTKYDFQQNISGSNGFISIDISMFWETRFKKAPGAVGKWGTVSKKFGFPIFLAKG